MILELRGTALIGDAQIFQGLDLSVSRGKWVSFLGPSGVGKSTALKLLAGLGDDVTFKGQITTPAQDQITLMSQSDLLLPWLTVLQNVSLGARLRAEPPDTPKALHILAKVGLSEFSERKPSGLSGGQRQRAALARTLMEDKLVVLLDEPFSALDALTRMQMQDLTADLLRGRTVLLVTHDPAEAVRLSDEIFVMRKNGVSAVAVPPGVTPRPVDADEVLRAQASLLLQLRKTAP